MGVIRNVFQSYCYFDKQICVLDVPFWAWLCYFEFRFYNSSAVHGPMQINADDNSKKSQ